MIAVLPSLLAASTVKSVGAVVAVLTLIGFVVYVVVNIRSGRDEIGSEIELAPNRKPYYPDEVLEGPRLTRALSTGLVLLAISALGLPLDLPLREAREAFERAYFEHHLALEGGSIAKVAEKSGLERTHLYRKLRSLGISTGRRDDS